MYILSEGIYPVNTVRVILQPGFHHHTGVDHALGFIANDPFFGSTKDIYAQFKPSFYPYYYGYTNDTIVGFWLSGALSQL